MTNFTKEQALDILIEAEIEQVVRFYVNYPEYLGLDEGTSEDTVRMTVRSNRGDDNSDPNWGELDSVNADVMFEGEVVNVKLVHETGGMDKGSNASMTFKIGDQYFTKGGYYQSHYGYDWDGDLYESFPTEVVVTVYKRLDRHS